MCLALRGNDPSDALLVAKNDRRGQLQIQSPVRNRVRIGMMAPGLTRGSSGLPSALRRLRTNGGIAAFNICLRFSMDMPSTNPPFGKAASFRLRAVLGCEASLDGGETASAPPS